MGEKMIPPEVLAAAEFKKSETLKGPPIVRQDRQAPSESEPVASGSEVERGTPDIDAEDRENYAREIKLSKGATRGNEDLRVTIVDEPKEELHARESLPEYNEAGLIEALRGDKLKTVEAIVQIACRSHDFPTGNNNEIRDALETAGLIHSAGDLPVQRKVITLNEFAVPVSLVVQGRERQVNLKFELVDYGQNGWLLLKEAKIKLGASKLLKSSS